MIHISQEELLRRIELEHRHILTPTNGDRIEAGQPEADMESFSSSSSSSSKTLQANCIRDKNNNSNNTTNCNNTTNSSNAKGKQEDGEEIKAALITGCGSQIGHYWAAAFAQKGFKVALVDFSLEQTETVARDCREQSPRGLVPLQIVADISQLDEAHKVIDQTIRAFGRLDVLMNTINNASLMEAKRFNGSGDDDPHVFEQYHRIIANNMHSVTYLCISAAPYLRKSRGAIVNMSSMTNNELGSCEFAYRMSKAGILTLSRCLATDLAPDIKVYCINPANEPVKVADLRVGGEEGSN